MQGKLDIVDVSILEGLAEHSPRNISRIAREISIPRGTILSRIKHMHSSFYLRLLAHVYHTFLGMKKAVVFADAKPGSEDILYKYLKTNEYYIYLSRYYGRFEGCLGIYVIPIEQTDNFKIFLREIEESGIVQDLRTIWSTCFHAVNRSRTWFDTDSGSWAFPWSEWVQEIYSEKGELPFTLKDPESFVLRADKTDIYILKELEKDATISLNTIAGMLGTTLQNIHYHYYKHVVKRQLLETFQIAIMPFSKETSEMLFLVLDFSDNLKMSKFAQSLLDKPFVYILGKVLDKSQLVAQLCLPKFEFRNFIDTLSMLVREGFLQNYDYVLQDLRSGKWVRETIPYQCFKEGAWIYDHEKHIKNLKKLISETS
ncbi:MAG: hypothetical protein PVH12_02035 [Candidatus Bathyarchaeota archaeon]